MREGMCVASKEYVDYMISTESVLSQQFQRPTDAQDVSSGWYLDVPPMHGNLQLGSKTGVWVYMPDKGYVGRDTFEVSFGEIRRRTVIEVIKMALKVEVTPQTIYLDEGEVALYDVQIQNIGSLKAEAITVYDRLEIGERYGSVMIETLQPGEQVRIRRSRDTFAWPEGTAFQLLEVIVRCSYTWQNGQIHQGAYKSKPIEIGIRHGELCVEPTSYWADRQLVQAKERVSCHLKLKHKGNIPLRLVAIKGLVPEGARLVEASSLSQAEEILATLGCCEEVQFSWEIEIEEGVREKLVSTPELVYAYEVDPVGQHERQRTCTYPTWTWMCREAQIEVSDVWCYDEVLGGDMCLLTTSVRNTGNIPFEKVVVRSTLSEGLEWYESGILLYDTRLEPGEVFVRERYVKVGLERGRQRVVSQAEGQYQLETRSYTKIQQGYEVQLLVHEVVLSAYYTNGYEKLELGDVFEDEMQIENRGTLRIQQLVLALEQVDGLSLLGVSVGGRNQFVSVDQKGIVLADLAEKEKRHIVCRWQVQHLEGPDNITRPFVVSGYAMCEDKQRRAIVVSNKACSTQILKPQLQHKSEKMLRSASPGEVVQLRYHLINTGNTPLYQLRLRPEVIEGTVSLGVDGQGEGYKALLEVGEAVCLVHRVRIVPQVEKSTLVSKASVQYGYQGADRQIRTNESLLESIIFEVSQVEEIVFTLEQLIQVEKPHAINSYLVSVAGIACEQEGEQLALSGKLRLSLQWDPRRMYGKEHTERFEIPFGIYHPTQRKGIKILGIEGVVKTATLQALPPHQCMIRSLITAKVKYLDSNLL